MYWIKIKYIHKYLLRAGIVGYTGVNHYIHLTSNKGGLLLLYNHSFYRFFIKIAISKS